MWGTIPRAPIHYGGAESLQGRRIIAGGAELLLKAPKSPNNVTSTFFNTVNLPSKELGFDHRGAKLRPWGRRICLFPRAPYNCVTPLAGAHALTGLVYLLLL